MGTQIGVLNSVAANGADITFDTVGRNMIVGGATTVLAPIPLRKLQSSKFQAYVAEVLQVQLVTPTGASATQFKLQLRGYHTITGAVRVETITYTSVGSTALEVSTAMIADIVALENFSITAAANGNNMDLTAVSPFPKFTATSVGTGTLTVAAASPAGVTGYGLGSLITATSSFKSSDIVSTNQYTTVMIENNALGDNGGATVGGFQETVLYINQGDADYTSLTSTYGVLSQAALGVKAIWTTAGGDASVANGVITLGGSDVFYGNTDTNIGLQASDVIVIGGVPYVIDTILTATTASTNSVPNDASAAATKYVKLRTLFS